MKKYLGLPIYQIQVDDVYDTDNELGMSCVSFVDDPAVETDFLTFNKEDKEKKQMMFAKVEEGLISGCAIRANYPIYRYDEKGGYYVVFTRDEIKKIVKKFSQKQNFNNTSLQHDGTPLKNVYLVEMYIKDSQRGIEPKEFDDIEDGSLFMTYKIDDDELWNEIKTSGKINGFSIEIMSYLNIIDTDADEFEKETHEEKDELETFIDNIFSEEDKKKSEEFVSEDEIDKIIDKQKIAIIDGKEVQILEQGTIDQRKVVVYYEIGDDEVNGKWQVKNLSDISSIKPTNKPLVEDWEEIMKKPSYKAIDDILDDIVVKKTATAPQSIIDQSIEEGLWVTINYNDEKTPSLYKGARQCFIVAHGFTFRGNECIRVLERYGTSRSVAEEGNSLGWRLMLTKRVLNMRPMPDMEKWDNDDLLADYNPFGDKSMISVLNHYTPKNYK